MGLDTVELIFEIENYFRVTIADTDAEQMSTVQDIASGVCRLLGLGPVAGPSAVQAATLVTLQQELRAVRRLPGPPAPTEFLSSVIGPDHQAWLPVRAGLARRTGWQLPELRVPLPPPAPTSWLGRLLSSAPRPERWPDWRRATVADLAGWIISLNAAQLFPDRVFRHPYDVLRAVSGLVSEKSGIDVEEIHPQDRITDDLGMD